MTTKRAVNRRIGREDSETRATLLRAALELMRAEGYAAVTSRRLAACAELKPQLVHYYFRDMVELFEEVFKLEAEKYLAVLSQIDQGEDSIARLWDLCCRREVAVQTIEFLALGNRLPSLKALMASYNAKYNAIQSRIIEKAMREKGIDIAEWSPQAVAMIFENLPRILAIGDVVGEQPSYDETRLLMSKLIDRLFGRP